MSGPAFAPDGMGYRLVDGDLVLGLSRLRESRGEVTGELRVAIGAEHLTLARFNLSSAIARKSMSTALAARSNGRRRIDWPDLLEQLCVGVLDAEHAPAVLVEIGKQPRREPVQRLVDPILLERASTLIFGPGGAGKSTLATALAVSLASGVEIVPSWRPQRVTRVLMLDYEATEDDFTVRVGQICAGASIGVPPGLYYQTGRRSLVDQVEDLAGALDTHDVGVLMVDSVGLAAGSTRDGGDAAETALRMFGALRTLGRSTLLVDHVRGDDVGGDRPSTRPYGSVYKVNLARNVYEVRGEETPGPGGSEVALLHRKCNDGPLLRSTGLRIVRDDASIRVERCDITAPDLESRTMTVADRSRRELRAGALTVRELSERLGVPAESIRTAIHRSSHLQRLSDGRVGLVL